MQAGIKHVAWQLAAISPANWVTAMVVPSPAHSTTARGAVDRQLCPPAEPNLLTASRPGRLVLPINSSLTYDAYRMEFGSLRMEQSANSMQLTEVQSPGTATQCSSPFADADGDAALNQVDFASFQVCTGRTKVVLSLDRKCLGRDVNTTIDTSGRLMFLECSAGPELSWSAKVALDNAP